MKWLKDLFRNKFEHEEEKEPQGCRYCRVDDPEPLFNLTSTYQWNITTRGSDIQSETTLKKTLRTCLFLQPKQEEGRPKDAGNAALVVYDEVPDHKLRTIQALHLSFCPVCGRKLPDVYDPDDENYIGDSEKEQP